MNMEHVTKVGGVVCRIEKVKKGSIIVNMYGKKKILYNSGTLVENHVKTGKFTSLPNMG